MAKSPRKPKESKIDPALSASVAESDAALNALKSDLQPIGDALKEFVADGKPKDPADGRTQPEYAMDKLAETPRVPPEECDPLDPVIQRGPNVDIVNNFKTSTKDQLTALGRRYKSMKEDQQGKAGEIGAMLTKAEETQNLDKWCFKEAMKWLKMSSDKKVRRLPIFMKYLDDLGVVDDATAQQDLLAKVETENVQTDIEDEAAEAATSLAPAKPRMTIVPKDDDDGEFKPLH